MKEYTGPVPCLLDPMKDCPSGKSEGKKCPLYEEAKRDLLDFSERVNQPPKKGLELFRTTALPGATEMHEQLRYAAAVGLTKSGKIGECLHPEANVLKGKTPQSAIYDGTVPCLLDFQKDCPANCGLHQAAKENLENSAHKQGISKAQLFQALRQIDKATSDRLRKEMATTLTKSSNIDKCLHPEANLLKPSPLGWLSRFKK